MGWGGGGGGGGGVCVMGNRQSTPSASCDLIRGRGGQPITTIASLCARWLLPAGAEREEKQEERGQNREKARDEWMKSVQGQRSEKKGVRGGTEMMWLCKG